MDYDSLEIGSAEVCHVLRITRGRLSQLILAGRGPAHTEVPAKAETSDRRHKKFTVASVLAFMRGRGASETDIKAARRTLIARHRLRLARAADAERIKAVSAIRSARRAREQAALAGHKPSIKIFERSDF